MSEQDQHKNKSALNVNKGIDQPPSINENAVQKFLHTKRSLLSVDEYAEGILKGNRTILSQAITLIESTLPKHHEVGQKVLEQLLPYAGNSIRIGITGVPGVGKSTFIESLGMMVIDQGHKLAVLAIDPSSERSGGSILGDKTRMETLSGSPHAFIRPSPSAGSLGGVARKTRETIVLCEAAGFDTIFIETVGVGQSEIMVHSMVDFFLLLMLAGAGDELQGIKRGIMEMADAIAITKADGHNINKSNQAKVQYENALHLFPPTPSGWTPKVKTCSSLENKGIPDIWRNIMEYKDFTVHNNFFHKNRNEQAKFWMYQTINEALKEHFYLNTKVKTALTTYEKKVLEEKISSFIAAKELLDQYFKSV